MGYQLHPFEAQAIHAMSVAYRNSYSQYNGKDASRPYYDKSSLQNQKSIKSALRGG